MTKQELYDTLTAQGVELPAYRSITVKELEELLAQSDQSDMSDQSNIKTLYFADSGWCEKLKMSYLRGYYRPKNSAEYLALREYAKQEVG